MPTARKPKRTSQPFSAAEIAAAKSAARRTRPTADSAVDWRRAVVTRGGGVAATIATIRRTRGPNKQPTKEQVAIRFDRDVLSAFRADGPGWQTRINDALKQWLAGRSKKRSVRDAAAAPR